MGLPVVGSREVVDRVEAPHTVQIGKQVGAHREVVLLTLRRERQVVCDHVQVPGDPMNVRENTCSI